MGANHQGRRHQGRMIGMTEGLRHARRHGPNTTGSVNDRSPKGGASGMLKPCIAAKENLLGRIGVLNIAGRSVVTVSESCADAVLRHRVSAAGPAKSVMDFQTEGSANNVRQ